MSLEARTGKEEELLGRMVPLLEHRGYKELDPDEVAIYRRDDGTTVVLWRTPAIHDPIKATVVSHTPTAWNSKGLAILLDAVDV